MDKALIVGLDDRAGDGRHNYMKGIAELMASGLMADLPKGKVSRLAIYHDDGCAIFSGGYCYCEPEFRLEEA